MQNRLRIFGNYHEANVTSSRYEIGYEVYLLNSNLLPIALREIPLVKCFGLMHR